MSESAPDPSMTTAQAQQRLLELAQLIRGGRPLDPATREQLAVVVTELGKDLGRTDLPASEVTHLTNAVSQVIQGLQRSQTHGLLAPAIDRLRQVIVRAEAVSPTTTRFAEQIIEILANLGI